MAEATRAADAWAAVTFPQYTLGLVLLCSLVAGLAVVATTVRRVLLPAAAPAVARVAEIIIGLATLVLVSELLGSVGEFRRWPLVFSCAALAAAAGVAFRKSAGPATSGDPPGAAAGTELRWRLSAVVLCTLGITVVLTPWLQHALDALHTGVQGFDTVTYHMPFAARFAQTGSLTGLQYDGNPPVSFYPANSELVHAVGILLFTRDLLSPLLNVLWLGFALLAGWCIGRPAGVAPATLAATGLVASLPVVASSQPGTANNDIAAMALLLAMVALVANDRRSPGAVAVAALAGGLAVGTKLNLWAPVLAVLVFAVTGLRTSSRSRAAAWSIVPLLLGGGFWYLRNLVTVGNPLPWFGLRIAGVLDLPSTSAPVDCGRTTVAHYLTRSSFIRAHLIPALESSIGARWWLVLGLAGASMVAGLLSRGSATARALAVVAVVSVVAYLFTPAGAGGVEARCFAFNTRFAVPALALALIVAPLALSSRGNRWLVLVVGCFLVALLLDADLSFAPLAAGLAIASVVCTIFIASDARRRIPPTVLAAAVVIVGLVVAAGGWHEQRVYFRERYRQSVLAEPSAEIAATLRNVNHARIAMTGLVEVYPLYGPDLSNRVDLPAARVRAGFVPYSTCRGWLDALRSGRYGYAVTATEGTRDSPVVGWTRRYPGARLLSASAPGFIHRGQPWRWQVFQLVAPSVSQADLACRSGGHGA